MSCALPDKSLVTETLQEQTKKESGAVCTSFSWMCWLDKKKKREREIINFFTFCEDQCGTVCPLGDVLEPLRAVIQCKHSRHVGEQSLGGRGHARQMRTTLFVCLLLARKASNRSCSFHSYLCCANVAGRLVSANVLLSGLQSQSIHLLTGRIPEKRTNVTSCLTRLEFNPSLWWATRHTPGDSDHPTRHHAHQVVSDGEEGGVRSAVAEGDPEPLRAAQCDVHAKLPGRTQHAESQQVRGTAGQRLHGTQSKKRAILIGFPLIIRVQKGVNTPMIANGMQWSHFVLCDLQSIVLFVFLCLLNMWKVANRGIN